MTDRPRPAARADRVFAVSAVVLGGLLASGPFAVAAPSATTHAVAPQPAVRSAADPQPAAPPQPEPDAASRSVAARARTNECGHQWNNMKRAGTAAGTTWKEFFRVCQAQR